MRTLDDAWVWYEASERLLRQMRRLAELHWDELPWEGDFGRDDQFRMLDRVVVRAEANQGLRELPDLAVVVLFSVFEAEVRTSGGEEVAQEVARLHHRALKWAAEQALERIREGSFFLVLQPFKDVHADLVEEVNQARRFRNWVAPGKQGEHDIRLSPRQVYDRLRRFLEVMRASPAGLSEAPAP